MARSGSTSIPRLAVLSVLEGGNRHAYEIGRLITEGSGGAIQIGDGTLYPLLQALESDGMLESWEDHSSTGRSVRMYALRRRGREELDRLTRAWQRESDGMRRLLETRWGK
ncbi:MAG: PadR family transcriptional regulator [Clostridia bacterium]